MEVLLQPRFFEQDGQFDSYQNIENKHEASLKPELPAIHPQTKLSTHKPEPKCTNE